MIKQKLTNKRVERNLSQEKIADLLGISQSQYNRRENGVTKISKKEWDKMAKVLDTTLENIYEPEDGIYIINNESANRDYLGSHNHFGSNNEYVFETMKKYIYKLEEEIKIKEQYIKDLEQK
ncbi:DNA-binding XRE family transcriptional regulator [Flavobacterium sp. 1]|uniref:helix-turn-helix transcriptional regulator n=1 Tax=Flavobacterium sp. 1 TaxID=2035200 RepID=UPI000C24F043|nr:helix-turn-helix transcriptional regulator [Flavobacterium sp. 1]PJJ10543.1 DNA-binding XRE family transcriptional regulator [Flavobacterium sp. 1]